MSEHYILWIRKKKNAYLVDEGKRGFVSPFSCPETPENDMLPIW
jgi:hypothetical protein